MQGGRLEDWMGGRGSVACLNLGLHGGRGNWGVRGVLSLEQDNPL